MTPEGDREYDVPGHIYLLHFSQPVGHAKHYLGWAKEGGLFTRLAQHERGNGASNPLVRALIAQGGTFGLARTWLGSKNDERRLKRRGSLVRVCPVCAGKASHAETVPPGRAPRTGTEIEEAA